jgi:hypothetical protein
MINKEKIRTVFTIVFLLSFLYYVINIYSITAIVFPVIMIIGAILGMITQHTMFFGRGKYADAYRNYGLIGFLFDFLAIVIGMFLLIQNIMRLM